MAKRALIFYGGGDGHEPDKTSARFANILQGHGYDGLLYLWISVINHWKTHYQVCVYLVKR